LNLKINPTTNIHTRIIEIVLGFILFAWGAYCFISWVNTSDGSSFKLAAAGLGVGCLLLFHAHRAGKKAALLEQLEHNQSLKRTG